MAAALTPKQPNPKKYRFSPFCWLIHDILLIAKEPKKKKIEKKLIMKVIAPPPYQLNIIILYTNIVTYTMASSTNTPVSCFDAMLIAMHTHTHSSSGCLFWIFYSFSLSTCGWLLVSCIPPFEGFTCCCFNSNSYTIREVTVVYSLLRRLKCALRALVFHRFL